MDDSLERLTRSLAGRYEILREVGRGGMAVVYLANDLRHGRQVAIKVFRPELASQAETGRFLREIEVSARLSHPNILALFDSGDADGLPYYVMPYVDGESLAARIYRDGPLPIDEAIRITRLVAAALQYAHDQGVIHRDIKPDNIMLSGESVLVADFGIARAVNAIGSERLTATGLSVGTPTFMSPEQITGSVTLDGRADIYSLGCVLYTMLLGEPPFSGQSVQAILARHLAEPIPNLRVVRATIPRAVEAVVHRSLAKAPVDRYASAGELAEALAPEHITDDALPSMASPRRGRRVIAAVGALVILVAAMLWLRPWSLTRRPTSSSPHLDPNLVAVVPFTMSSVSDTAFRDLGRQLPSLVLQRLPGDGGPRAVVVGAGETPDAQRRAALARGAGAGQVMSGQIDMLDGRLSFTATLHDLQTDSLVSQVSGIAGPPDSLPVLMDHLVATILIDRLGVDRQRRVALAALPLATLRRFLGAIASFKRGAWFEASNGFEAVLAVDSTCYPAALWNASVAMKQLDAGGARRPLALARSQIGRMSEADTSQLHSLAPNRPDGTPLTPSERLQALDNATSHTSETYPLRWYLLGERLFHDGPLLGIPDMLRLAARAFDHVIAVDPGYLLAMGHAIDLAAAQGDTAKVRALAREYFARDSVGDLSDYYRWRVAIALEDSAQLATVRARMDRFSRASLEQVVNVAQLDGEGISDAVHAATTLWAQSGAGSQARWAFTKRRELALNRGRPAEATRLLDQWRRTGVQFRPRDGMAEVVDALFWGADTTFPAQWVREQLSTLSGAPRTTSGLSPGDLDYLRCGTSLWLALRNDGPVASVRVPVLSPAVGIRDSDSTMMRLCRAVVRASLARRNASRGATVDLRQLDSLVASLPTVTTWLLAAGNLTAARLWETEGNLDRALVAVRRRPYITDVNEPRVLVGLSTMLRDEGRLATLTGDTAGAVTAYRRYLALRADPEPAVAAEVDAVRAALARLGGP